MTVSAFLLTGPFIGIIILQLFRRTTLWEIDILLSRCCSRHGNLWLYFFKRSRHLDAVRDRNLNYDKLIVMEFDDKSPDQIFLANVSCLHTCKLFIVVFKKILNLCIKVFNQV